MEIKNNHTKFIAFEGIDGSGKSTQIELLARRMKENNYPVYQTFEPTDGPVGRLIRDVFAHKIEADHRTIAGLFVADRLHHLLESENGVLAQMRRGKNIIMDRYLFSSYAYQGAHTDLEWVIDANAESDRLLRPDLYVFLDITPEESLERLKSGRDELELFETLENLEKVYEMYRIILDRFREEQEILIVDGTLSETEVAGKIWDAVEKKLSRGERK